MLSMCVCCGGGGGGVIFVNWHVRDKIHFMCNWVLVSSVFKRLLNSYINGIIEDTRILKKLLKKKPKIADADTCSIPIDLSRFNEPQYLMYRETEW